MSLILHKARRMVWTEANVQALLVEAFFVRGTARGFSPNVMYGFGEADLMLSLPSGYATEFEIKLSRQDFVNDTRHKVDKHAALAAAFEAARSTPQRPLPNRLFYVLPERLKVMAPEVPPYAGMIWVADDGALTTVLGAPRIHRVKFAEFRDLTVSLSWRLSQHLLPVKYETEKGELT